jgi:hypothetical protein
MLFVDTAEVHCSNTQKKYGKKVVTPHWIDDVVRHGTTSLDNAELFDISKALHTPIKSPKCTLLKDCIVSVTGWSGVDRYDIIYAIGNLGATYTGTFSKKNTHLISKDSANDAGDKKKITKAIEWKIPILKQEWIYDCTTMWTQAPISQKYLWIEDQDIGDEVLKVVKKQRLENGDSKATVVEKKIEERCILVSNGYELKDEIEKLPGGKMIESTSYFAECTHIILPVLKRTEKFLCACSAGKWVVKPEFIKESIKKGQFVDEEDFEWSSQTVEQCTSSSSKPLWLGAPHYWRIQREKNGGGAFKGKTILVYTSSSTPPKDVLQKVIQSGEGKPIICVTSTVLKDALVKETSYAVVDQEASAADKFIKLLKKNNIKMYKTILLLDMFTLKPTVDPETYRMFK